MEYQECRTCKRQFPKTIEFFNWEIRKKGEIHGLRKRCKECVAFFNLRYREDRKDRPKESKERINYGLYEMKEITEQNREALLFSAYSRIHFLAFNSTLPYSKFIDMKLIK